MLQNDESICRTSRTIPEILINQLSMSDLESMTRQGTWSPGNSTPPSQTSGGRQTSPTPGTGIESMAEPEDGNLNPESYHLYLVYPLNMVIFHSYVNLRDVESFLDGKRAYTEHNMIHIKFEGSQGRSG